MCVLDEHAFRLCSEGARPARIYLRYLCMVDVCSCYGVRLLFYGRLPAFSCRELLAASVFRRYCGSTQLISLVCTSRQS